MIRINTDGLVCDFYVEEMDKATEIYTGVIEMDIQIEQNHIDKSKLIIIPYKEFRDTYKHSNGEVNKGDIYDDYENFNYIVKRPLGNVNNSINLYNGLVPEKYNFLDIFIYPSETLRFTRIENIKFYVFNNYAREAVFSYVRDFQKKNPFGIHIGTWARVLNGWRFHPLMRTMMFSSNKLISLAIGE